MNRTQVERATGRAAAAIRPARPADLPALRDFFEALSPQARYLRFFAPVTPGAALLAQARSALGALGSASRSAAAARAVVAAERLWSIRADRPAPSYRRWSWRARASGVVVTRAGLG